MFLNSESPNRDLWVRGFSERRVCDNGGCSRGVSRTRSFMLWYRKGLSCDTSGWGCRPLVSQRRSEGVVPKVLWRARDVAEDYKKRENGRYFKFQPECQKITFTYARIKMRKIYFRDTLDIYGSKGRSQNICLGNPIFLITTNSNHRPYNPNQKCIRLIATPSRRLSITKLDSQEASLKDTQNYLTI